MEVLAREKAEKLLNKDNNSRRKLRQLQVRQQSNEWMERNRKKYMEERQAQIKLITESLVQDAQEHAVKDIEILERMHDLCVAEVGAAHRAAANLSDFELLQTQKNQENYERARSRGAQALAQEKLAAEKAVEQIKRIRILRENVRREEDERLREFVQRPSRMTNSQAAVDRIVDKLTNKRSERKRHPEYQPSLAKALRVPKDSNSDTKISKHKRHPRLSRKPKDVVYYDTSIPQGVLKYPPPPGLVEKMHKGHSGNAFEIAKRIAREQRSNELKQKAEDLEKAKEAERRGKTALKVAKLQRQLDEIKNEFFQSGFQVDPKLNDSFLGLSDSGSEEEGDSFQTGNTVDPFSQGYSEQKPVSFSKAITGKDPKLPASPKSKQHHPALPETGKKSKKPAEPPKTEFAKPYPSPKRDTAQAQDDKPMPKSPQKNLNGATTTKPSAKVEVHGSPAGSARGDKIPKSPKKDSSLIEKPPKSPKTDSVRRDKIPTSPTIDSTQGDKIPKSPLKDSRIPKATPKTGSAKTAIGEATRKEQSKPETSGAQNLLLETSDQGSPDSRHPSGRSSPLERSIVLPTDIQEELSSTPKLLSSRKSVRNEQKQLDSVKESGAIRPDTPVNRGQVTPTKDSGQGKGPGHAKQRKDSSNTEVKKITKSPENSQAEAEDQGDTSDTLHTLPTIASGSNQIKKQVPDRRSLPGRSKELFSSTPDIDADTESPIIVRKRKQVLMYYVKKLLEMRPETKKALAATSSGSISSCIEIPSSVISSFISSSTPVGSTSNESSTGETTKNNKSKNNFTYFETTNGSTDHYTTTLSSVTEEEEDDLSELRNYEQESEQTSSGESLAKITVAVSPRSK